MEQISLGVTIRDRVGLHSAVSGMTIMQPRAVIELSMNGEYCGTLDMSPRNAVWLIAILDHVNQWFWKKGRIDFVFHGEDTRRRLLELYVGAG